MIISCGCVSIPFLSGSPTTEETVQDTDPQEPIPPDSEQLPEGAYEIPPPPEEISTPEPTPTPLISTVTDWNPYGVIPLPETIQKRASIFKNEQNNNNRIGLNTTYSGTVGLGGFAIGKELNITKGPFSITYTAHPNITDLTNPNIVWAKITVRDPWQRIMAENGYNREFSSEETKTITIFREGVHDITFEGEFVTLDYTLKTGDFVVATPTPVQAASEEIPEELWEGG